MPFAHAWFLVKICGNGVIKKSFSKLCKVQREPEVTLKVKMKPRLGNTVIQVTEYEITSITHKISSSMNKLMFQRRLQNQAFLVSLIRIHINYNRRTWVPSQASQPMLNTDIFWVGHTDVREGKVASNTIIPNIVCYIRNSHCHNLSLH